MPYTTDPYAVNPFSGGSTGLTPVTPGQSGTSNFTLDIGELVTEAHERCGLLNVTGRDYRTARRSIDLMMIDWGNRGINLWKVESGSQVLTQGTQTYTLPANCIDIIDAVLRTYTGQNTQDYTLNRISVSTWATIPNKLVQSRPVEIYVDRQAPAPILTVWPVPDGATSYTVVYWYLQRIQDTGQPASNTMDVPFRFLPALAAGLAYYVGMKRPKEVPLDQLQALKAVYDEAWMQAAGEDRTRASVRFVPYVPYIGA